MSPSIESRLTDIKNDCNLSLNLHFLAQHLALNYVLNGQSYQWMDNIARRET